MPPLTWWHIKRNGTPWASLLATSPLGVAALLLDLAGWKGGQYGPLGRGRYLMRVCNIEYQFQARRSPPGPSQAEPEQP